ncbi:MAG: polysaccharide deacetylase family protein [Methanomassiliicoccales archaeon]
MRIFFINRRQVRGILLVTLLTLIAIGGIGVYVSLGSAEKVTAPVYYQGNTGDKVVALDINVDWGEEYVPQMLEILAETKIKASFFVTGTWAQKHPDLVRKMAEQGHDVQNHGHHHLHLTRASNQVILDELSVAEGIIQEASGIKPVLFAPPYGETDNRVNQLAANQGYQVVLWSLDTIDWQRPSPNTIAQRIIKRLHNDAIVLMHPTAPTVKALPIMIGELKSQGYQIKLVREIIPASIPASTGNIGS